MMQHVFDDNRSACQGLHLATLSEKSKVFFLSERVNFVHGSNFSNYRACCILFLFRAVTILSVFFFEKAWVNRI